MGEIKSVKVDNWGVFFLQKLQNFFNKTDYCDLTLQFRDNSQLKVHRLVLSACTDYFNVLEQTCDVVDDALLMPDELQADVVVPIVNFMYTGTLEFELKMYDKLLRTAKEMNMTVLLKLLEAHRRTMEGVNRTQRPPSPKTIRRGRAPGGNAATYASPQQQQRRILTAANVTTQQNRLGGVQTKNMATNASQSPATQYKQLIGATSLLRTGGGTIKTQYGTTTIYNTSSQQQQQQQQLANSSPNKQSPQQQQQQTSPFEQLRKGYNNNKRPAPTTFVSPPAKKPNIEDVKEFAEQQRMRKQIAAEYGDEADYEGMLMDDDIHNDDDDEDAALNTSGGGGAVASTSKQITVSSGGGGGGSPQATTITFRHDSADKPPTIVVKDSSNSKMNHAKIISEVLRQYPHLVKGNKNIKLKIMPSAGGQTQKIIVKKEPLDSPEPSSHPPQQLHVSSVKSGHAVGKSALPTGQQAAKSQQALQTSNSNNNNNSASGGGGAVQKRRIDSKTMHNLIAQGAENTTGPWLCLRCGVSGRPISIPSYRGFRRHLINTHKESIDPALCEHCGWRSRTNRELHFHMQVEHKVRTNLYTFPECLMCADLFLDTNALNQHMLENHTDENKQQCIYCNKIFAKELQLYTHMKTYHKKQALEDGIIDYSDEEMNEEGGGGGNKATKVKILSNISLPTASPLIKLEPSSEAAALSTVASGIATSIGISSAEEYMPTTTTTTTNEVEMASSAAATASEDEEHEGNEHDLSGGDAEPKFVNADGNEMVLTAEQRKEIMSQLNEGGAATSGGVVMVLNEPGLDAAGAAAATAGEQTADEEEEDEAEEYQAENEAHAEEEQEADGLEEEHEHEDETGVEGEAEAEAEDEDFDDSEIFNELTGRQQQQQASAANAKHSTPASTAATASAVKKDQRSAGALEESKESMEENLEWAENVISAHDLADDVPATVAAGKRPEEIVKKTDDISKKLKELTGDWSDEEDEDDQPFDDEEDHAGEEEEHEQTVEEQAATTTTTTAKTTKTALESSKDLQDEEVLDEEDVDTKSQSSLKSTDKPAAKEALVTKTTDASISPANGKGRAAVVEQKVQQQHADVATDDDIDATMKSLHKGQDSLKESKANVSDDEEANISDDEPMDTHEADEPTIASTAVPASIKEEKRTPVKNKDSAVVSDADAAAATGTEAEQTGNARLGLITSDLKAEKSLTDGVESEVAKALLDELAAEADMSKSDEEEFIDEKPVEEEKVGRLEKNTPVVAAVSIVAATTSLDKELTEPSVVATPAAEEAASATVAVEEKAIETPAAAEASVAAEVASSENVPTKAGVATEGVGADAVVGDTISSSAIAGEEGDGDAIDEAAELLGSKESEVDAIMREAVEAVEEDDDDSVPNVPTTTTLAEALAATGTTLDEEEDDTVTTTTTSAMAVDTAVVTAATAAVKTGEDKVKSLISEWGDDEDDDGDEDL